MNWGRKGVIIQMWRQIICGSHTGSIVAYRADITPSSQMYRILMENTIFAEIQLIFQPQQKIRGKIENS